MKRLLQMVCALAALTSPAFAGGDSPVPTYTSYQPVTRPVTLRVTDPGETIYIAPLTVSDCCCGSVTVGGFFVTEPAHTRVIVVYSN